MLVSREREGCGSAAHGEHHELAPLVGRLAPAASLRVQVGADGAVLALRSPLVVTGDDAVRLGARDRRADVGALPLSLVAVRHPRFGVDQEGDLAGAAEKPLERLRWRAELRIVTIRGTPARIDTGLAEARNPIWTGDGEHLVFTAHLRRQLAPRPASARVRRPNTVEIRPPTERLRGAASAQVRTIRTVYGSPPVSPGVEEFEGEITRPQK